MKKNVALSISVGLNVVLAAFLALHLAAGVSSSAPSSIASITQQGAGDARQIEQALRTAGFGEFESKQLVEALLLQRATRIASYEYWRSPPVRDAAETIAALERAAQVRAALLAAYGPGAAEDPAFSRSFRPYEREFPKFSSARQLQIGQQALERLKARSGSGAQPGFMPVSRSDAATDALEQALDPDERFEYRLRESTLARALSVMPFDFSESEFRAVFGILATARPKLVAAPSSASLDEAFSDDAVRKSLATAMDANRYEEFRRARDPSYGLLRRIADVRGISRENIDKAYTILTSAKISPSDPTRTPAGLAAVLGPAADDVYRTYLFTRQPPGPGGPPGQPAMVLRVSPTSF